MAASPSALKEETAAAATIANLDPAELYMPATVISAREAVVAPPLPSPPAQSMENNSNYNSFQVIRHNTGVEIDQSRPISRRQERSLVSSLGEKNQAAGAASSLNAAARQEQARQLTRGASESALDNMSIPTNVRQFAKAIMATGKGGALEPAATPSAEKELTMKTQSMYRPLWGEEEEEEHAPKVLTIRNKSSIDWTSLQGPLPGAPEKKEKATKRCEVESVATGLTSFSDEVTKSIAIPTLLPVITRRQTNPFLNEAFMNSLTSSTPPTPTTTKTTAPSNAFNRLSPGNPFIRLAADPEVNNFDDEFGGEEFYDTPQTPLQVEEVPSYQSNNPFFFSSVITQQEAQDEEDVPKTPNPTSLSPIKKQHQPILKKSRSVHFDQETSLKASDSPRCPACRRAFIDLTSVLFHIDNTDCNPFNLSEGQLISAH